MLKVNGKAYDWGDVDLKIPGLNIQVQEISYDDELEIEEVYGYGSKPRGYGTGNYKASGKLSMLRDDYDDLLAYCKQKGVPFYKMELPSIIVSYANEGARTKIDELKKVKTASQDQLLKAAAELFPISTANDILAVLPELEKRGLSFTREGLISALDQLAEEGKIKRSVDFLGNSRYEMVE